MPAATLRYVRMRSIIELHSFRFLKSCRHYLHCFGLIKPQVGMAKFRQYISPESCRFVYLWLEQQKPYLEKSRLRKCLSKTRGCWKLNFVRGLNPYAISDTRVYFTTALPCCLTIFQEPHVPYSHICRQETIPSNPYFSQFSTLVLFMPISSPSQQKGLLSSSCWSYIYDISCRLVSHLEPHASTRSRTSIADPPSRCRGWKKAWNPN